MEIRPGNAEDAEAVADAHHAAIEELGATVYDDQQVAAWSAGRSPDDYEFGGDDRDVFVAEIDGAVRGFGWLSHEPGEHLTAHVDGEVTGMYVHPDVAREGVGTALLERLETRARERGLDALGMWASMNAVPFYETQGYERVAERVHEFGGGVTGRVLELRKDL